MANALDLNGTTQYLTRANSSSLNFDDGKFCIHAKVYFDTVGSSQAIATQSDASTNRGWELIYSSAANRFRITIFDGASTSIVTKDADTFGAASISTWYTVVAYYDDTTQECGISINGGAFDTATGTGTYAASTNGIALGSLHTTGTLLLNGRLQDFAIFTGDGSKLTATQAAWLHNGGNRRNWWELGRAGDGVALFDSLAEWWPLEEIQGVRRGICRGLSMTDNGGAGAATGVPGAAADNRAPVTVATNASLTSGSLAGKTSDQGDTWTQHDTDTQALTVSASGGIYNATATAGTVILDSLVRSTDQRIEAGFEYKTATQQVCGILYKMQSTSGSFNGYRLVYDDRVGQKQWVFNRYVGGASTTLGTYAQTLTPGTTYSIRIESTRIYQLVYIDNNLVFGASDDSDAMHGGGRIGVRSVLGSASATTGMHIINPRVARGTWETVNVWLRDDWGGSDTGGNNDFFHVSNLMLNGNTLNCMTERRYDSSADGARSEINLKQANIATDWTSFGSEIDIVTETDRTPATGTMYNSPNPVLLSNGDILVMYCAIDPGYANIAGYGGTLQATVGGSGSSTTAHVWLARSTDGGATWSRQEITDLVKDTANWAAMYPYATGLELSSGRVVWTMGHKRNDSGTWRNYTELIYSDSFIGQSSGSPALSSVTFTRGGDLGTDGGGIAHANNEATLFFNSSGKLVAATRAYLSTTRKKAYGVYATDEDTNIASLSYYDLPDCNAHFGVHKYRGIVLTAPMQSNDRGERRNVTLRWSDDDGATWNAPASTETAYPWGNMIQISGGHYSNIVATDDHVYVLFGCGGQHDPDAVVAGIDGAITLARMPVSTLGITYATSGSAPLFTNHLNRLRA